MISALQKKKSPYFEPKGPKKEVQPFVIKAGVLTNAKISSKRQEGEPVYGSKENPLKSRIKTKFPGEKGVMECLKKVSRTALAELRTANILATYLVEPGKAPSNNAEDVKDWQFEAQPCKISRRRMTLKAIRTNINGALPSIFFDLCTSVGLEIQREDYKTASHTSGGHAPSRTMINML